MLRRLSTNCWHGADSYNTCVDKLDIFALSGLEWGYDRVEDRFGRVAAWVVTMALALAVSGIAAAVLVVIL